MATSLQTMEAIVACLGAWARVGIVLAWLGQTPLVKLPCSKVVLMSDTLQLAFKHSAMPPPTRCPCNAAVTKDFSSRSLQQLSVVISKPRASSAAGLSTCLPYGLPPTLRPSRKRRIKYSQVRSSAVKPNTALIMRSHRFCRLSVSPKVRTRRSEYKSVDMRHCAQVLDNLG